MSASTIETLSPQARRELMMRIRLRIDAERRMGQLGIVDLADQSPLLNTDAGGWAITFAAIVICATAFFLLWICL